MTEGTYPGRIDNAQPAANRGLCAGDMIRLADEAYRRRGDITAGSCVSGIERLLETSDSYEVQWRLSRSLFVDGERHPQEYARGAVHGRRAIKLNGEAVEGYFWTGVNLALHAQARKRPASVLALLEARRTLRKACKISEGYHGAGPLRVLGRLEHKCPKILGGSLARSLSYYERALAIAPTNTVTLIYAADLAIERQDCSKAAGLLEKVLSLPIDPDWEFENIRDKTLAKSMLKLCGRTR